MAENGARTQNPTRDLFGVALLTGGLGIGASLFGWLLGALIGFGVAAAALVGAFVSYAVRASQPADRTSEQPEAGLSGGTKALLAAGALVAGGGGVMRLVGRPREEGARVAARITGDPPPFEAVLYDASASVLALGGLLLTIGAVVWIARLLTR